MKDDPVSVVFHLVTYVLLERGTSILAIQLKSASSKAETLTFCKQRHPLQQLLHCYKCRNGTLGCGDFSSHVGRRSGASDSHEASDPFRRSQQLRQGSWFSLIIISR